MHKKEASQFVTGLRDKNAGWKDPCHIATTTFRKGVTQQLSRDSQLRADGAIVLAAFFLSEKLPGIDGFCGIFQVDAVGIWYFDGDGHVDAHVWRQGVIPWRFVRAVRFHKSF